MGQAGSHPPAAVTQRPRRSLTMPHEPPRLAPKVLPSLAESPRLRSTDNGAILHSGGTISGRRPVSFHDLGGPPPNGHVHSSGYRSRSAGGDGDPRLRERDPLHRSHTNLDLRHNDSSSINKRFGSEPDLRIEEEQKSRTNNKNFRKKYRAPAPPNNDHIDGSSPDSSEGNSRTEPNRKLRLFRTRHETKKLNGNDPKMPYRHNYIEYKSLDLHDNNAFERRYRSPYKDREPHYKYPENRDMMQSSASLKREERLLQQRQDYKKPRTDRMSGCRAKTSKTNESEAWKTPLLNRNFRYSERFRKDDSEIPTLRREKTFDDSLIASERDSESPRMTQASRSKAIGEQAKKPTKASPLVESAKPLRKSLPSLLPKNNEEKDEFQAELKKATSRIRHEIGGKVNNVSENKTSQNNKLNVQKPNPTKVQSKVKESSLTNVSNKQDAAATRRPLARKSDVKPKNTPSSNVNGKIAASKYKYSNKENGRPMPDRGQASGKESTPEHSPTRKIEAEIKAPEKQTAKAQAPSKQFYFGMIETKQAEPRQHLKEFPGLGSPIIEEIGDFRLIEKKLLGYHDEDAEFEKFNAKLKKECKIKNISSESALSSDASDASGSEGSLGIAMRLRPTLPKKHFPLPRFSPDAAWRQLAHLDAHLAAETRALAVETKISGDILPESSPRSEQSADKSGDSGISGDHDNRLDSPSRHHVAESNPTWTPQQDLGDSSSEGAGTSPHLHNPGTVATYSPGTQPFSLSLPRDAHERGKQIQQGFNSLQKLRKSVSGALGAALGSRRFDLEHEPILPEPEQNWFLTKSAPNSLSNPLLYQPSRVKAASDEDVIKEEEPQTPEKEEEDARCSWRPSPSYLSWGGHVMYLPPAADQPLSMIGHIERPVRSKSSGCLEAAARSARSARAAPSTEMRERERSASPDLARALPARVEPAVRSSVGGRGKRFTFQSTVRQLERRRLAEKLSKEADLKEQQRRTELEAMRRVEEEFQRKRAREKANIRQQLRLVSSGASSMPAPTNNAKNRDSPDGSCRESPAPERSRDGRQRHSNASSEISGRSKSTTPIRSVELSEPRVYRDWACSAAAALAHDHPPACARIRMTSKQIYNGGETEAFSGSPVSDNYRLEFARGRSPRSPRTPRAPRLLAAPRSPSTSGSELSMRQPIKISNKEPSMEEVDEPPIVPTIRPRGPSRAALAAI